MKSPPRLIFRMKGGAFGASCCCSCCRSCHLLKLRSISWRSRFQSVISGQKSIFGLDVEPGRVGYIILENPTDFRMKLAVNAYVHNVDLDKLNSDLAVLDARLPHSEVMAQLNYDAHEYGPFRLICYDTYQAGFSGAQFNDNNDMFATRRHCGS
jgi:hypothetical protein